MRWERWNGVSLQRSTRSRAERPWDRASVLERRQRRLAMCLALIAGYVDAYGLSAFGTYVSFMSGNTTQVGSMTGHGRLVEAVPPALAILSFVGGSCAGTYLTHSRLRHSRRLLFGVVATLLAAAAAVSRIGPAEVNAGIATGEMTEPSCDARYSNWRFQPDLRRTTRSFRCIGIVIIPSDLQRATARAPRSPTAWHRSPSASKSSTAPAGSRGTRSTAAET